MFLHCFVDGMAVSRKAALQFHPDDQVMDVYHAIYGGYPVFGDNMELERVLAAVGAAFGKRVDDLHRVWHGDITLGELFAFASAIQT